MNLEKTLTQYGLAMPQPPEKGGLYEPVKAFGANLFYLSGCGPNLNGEKKYEGKIGREYTIEEGRQAARCCVLNLLAVLQKRLGSLNKVKRIVKLTVFVACADDFYSQPEVANGASGLLVEIFGAEAGCGARSAVGANALPFNIPVEIEALVEAYS